MKRLPAALLLSCLVILVSACGLLGGATDADGGTTVGTGGGSGTGGGNGLGGGAGGGSGGLTVEAYCPQLMDASAVIMACTYPSKATALELYARLYTCDDIARAVNAKTAAFDPVKAKACLDGMRALTCITSSQGSPEVCASVFTGTVAPGGACHLATECTPGSFCQVTGASGAPVCPGRCVAYAKAGEACGGASGGYCGRGTVCDIQSHVCLALPNIGEACTSLCNFGAYCGPDHRCTAQVTSGACPTGRECAAPTTCVYSAASPTCQPRVALGQACGGSTGVCDYGLRCDSVSRVCEAYRPLGAACTPPSSLSPLSECGEGYCDQHTRLCTASKAMGAACTPGAMECGYLVSCNADGGCPVDTACHVP